MMGLKSINERISKLEEVTDNVIEPQGFVDVVMSNQIKKKNNTTKAELEKLKNHFDVGLKKNINYESNLDLLTNVSRVVEYTVRYIESNIGKIASLFNTGVSSELKLETAVLLIKDFITDFPETFIINSIEHMVSLIFNSNKEPDLPINNVITKKGSIKKSMKYLMKNCKGK